MVDIRNWIASPTGSGSPTRNLWSHRPTPIHSGPIARILQERATEVLKQEMDRGASLIGPHRDDLHLQLGDFPAKGYASHGESWSMAIALRIGSFTLLRDEGSSPILILDDIFAELDTARRAQLVAITHLAEQTFITAAVESDLPADLLTQRFYVIPGKVSREAGAL